MSHDRGCFRCGNDTLADKLECARKNGTRCAKRGLLISVALGGYPVHAEVKTQTRRAHDDLVLAIEDAEQRAHKLGLHVTGHALNRAKNALGWEVAGDVEQAGRAARGERREKRTQAKRRAP